MKIEFLDLGMQPIANNFLSNIDQAGSEYMYHLTVVFDEETNLVSLKQFVPPKMMFNDSYVYHSSLSKTMREHFSSVAKSLKEEFSPKVILEIGSNDGVFLKHFSKSNAMSIEPCGNFADLTREMGYNTLSCFWDNDSAEEVLRQRGEQDLIYAANCMCHIQDVENAFKNIAKVISKDGIFVFEDPSLFKILNRGSYDQLYGAHAYIFSVTALSNVLKNCGLDIFRVQETDVHGGSNRIFACAVGSREIENSVISSLDKERNARLNDIETYVAFADRVAQSKEQLVGLLTELKRGGNKIISYGATAKSTTVFNYCKIDTSLIDYIVDITPAKQGKFSPGMHIPVISPEEGFDESANYAFLGAWNYEKEITEKEAQFLKNGRFISHVPYVRVIGGMK